MKVSLLQINTVVGDLHGNAEIIKEFVRKAADFEPDLIVTPELALTGYPPRDLLLINDFVNEAERTINKLAFDLEGYPPVLVGTLSKNRGNSGKPLHNSAVLCKDGKICNIFHKTLLPAYDVFDEERYFEPGRNPHILAINGEKIGILICEDIWTDERIIPAKRYHEDPVFELAKEEISCFINISASPFTIGKHQLREQLLSAIAQKYHVPVLFLNMVGGNDDLVFDGRSSSFNADGKLTGRAKAFTEDILTLDYSTTEEQDIFPDNFIPEEEAFRALVLGTYDYIKKTGFRDVILGLSGGIDSSLTAAIATEALTKEKVLGVLLPSPFTSEESIKDALLLAGNLGIRTITIPIGPMMAAAYGSLAKSFVTQESGVAEENIQARIRGLLLMAISNKTGSLLLTTGNKSELSVGYCTLYGDMSGGLGVISDVPKTMVFRIAKWLNSTNNRSIIPESVLLKPPSAELRPGQRDDESLPAYDILDPILFQYIEEHASPVEIINAGFPEEIVYSVCKLVKQAEFKRRQAAPGIKITSHAFGTGWRMPVASKFWF